MDRNTFVDLPQRMNADGEPRKLGVEIEFAELDEATAARLLADHCASSAEQVGEGRWQCRTDRFGTCKIYVDTRFADDITQFAGQTGLAVARVVVPVELVTEPFDPRALPALDAVVGVFRESGAVGSRNGLAYGFGVHLNIEIAETTVDHLWRTLTAFALIEDHLRAASPMDVSRRMLPFTDSYPDGLIDALSAGPPRSVGELVSLYLDHTTSRNHGLDMLPILAGLDADTVAGRTDNIDSISPRPAYHFRMPDSRVDESEWSLVQEWRRWVGVERAAGSNETLDALRVARKGWSDRPRLGRPRWRETCRHVLAENGMEDAAWHAPGSE